MTSNKAFRGWVYGAGLAMLAAYAPAPLAQTLGQQISKKHRQSVVMLRASKTTSTGEVVVVHGTGFVVTERGHVITSCHVVDRLLRDAQGKVLDKAVDSVSVVGAVASKAGPREDLAVLGCESPEIDVALLKFHNTSIKRVPVRTSPKHPEPGEELGAMGFPLDTEFFLRQGTVSGDDTEDRLVVAMTMNVGDSGAPVFDRDLSVVAIAEAGLGPPGSGIGIARPVRHAPTLLARAGINIFAINADLSTVPASGQPLNSNIFYSLSNETWRIFGKPAPKTAALPAKVQVTYPVFQPVGQQALGAMPAIDLKQIAAQPGFKVIDARFVITEESHAKVVHVGPSPDGNSVRAVFKPDSSASAPDFTNAFVKGYIETQQVRIK